MWFVYSSKNTEYVLDVGYWEYIDNYSPRTYRTSKFNKQIYNYELRHSVMKKMNSDGEISIGLTRSQHPGASLTVFDNTLLSIMCWPAQSCWVGTKCHPGNSYNSVSSTEDSTPSFLILMISHRLLSGHWRGSGTALNLLGSKDYTVFFVCELWGIKSSILVMSTNLVMLIIALSRLLIKY